MSLMPRRAKLPPLTTCVILRNRSSLIPTSATSRIDLTTENIMFRKLASEALGLSDVGIVVAPANFDKVDADDYLFHEIGEKIFFLIKSKKDEYCFTNYALIHVDGESAISSKRVVKRYEFSGCSIENVTIETAGTIDMDVELHFSISGVVFSIDIKKSFIEDLKDIYKALYSIGKLQRREEASRENALRCLDAAASMYKINTLQTEDAVTKQFSALLMRLNSAMLDQHTTQDFSHVFQRYIRVPGEAKQGA
jgi:hypothetical protein